jgi:hypothetical protein
MTTFFKMLCNSFFINKLAFRVVKSKILNSRHHVLSPSARSFSLYFESFSDLGHCHVVSTVPSVA